MRAMAASDEGLRQQLHHVPHDRPRIVMLTRHVSGTRHRNENTQSLGDWVRECRGLAGIGKSQFKPWAVISLSILPQ